MTEFVDVAAVSDLPDGKTREFTVNGKPVLLARVGVKVYAMQAKCPHLGGSLAKGELDGTVIQCPLHGSRFDVTDGRVVRWLKGEGLLSSLGTKLKKPQPLAVYATRVENGRIFVKID